MLFFSIAYVGYSYVILLDNVRTVRVRRCTLFFWLTCVPVRFLLDYCVRYAYVILFDNVRTLLFYATYTVALHDSLSIPTLHSSVL